MRFYASIMLTAILIGAITGCGDSPDAGPVKVRADAEQTKAEPAKAKADTESAKPSPKDPEPAVPAKTSDARIAGKWKGANNAFTLEFFPNGDLKTVDNSPSILPPATGSHTYEVFEGGFLHNKIGDGLFSGGGFSSYLWKYTISGDQLNLQPVLNWKGDVAGDAWRFNKLN